MKTKTLLFLFVVPSIVVFGCVQNPQTSMENMGMEENSDAEFKKMCQSAGYEWMLMKPTKDGKINKEAESCWGCMVGGIEHVCDMNQFNEMTGMENMESEMDSNNMHSMQHMAMTAHAGNRNSVDVHMYKAGFIRPDVQPGKEDMLKFTISELQSKKPVSDLD